MCNFADIDFLKTYFAAGKYIFHYHLRVGNSIALYSHSVKSPSPNQQKCAHFFQYAMVRKDNNKDDKDKIAKNFSEFRVLIYLSNDAIDFLTRFNS